MKQLCESFRPHPERGPSLWGHPCIASLSERRGQGIKKDARHHGGSRNGSWREADFLLHQSLC